VASSVAVAASSCPAGPRGSRLTVAMRRFVVNSIVVALVLPLRIAAWAAGGLGAGRSATRLRALMAGVPIAAYVVTGVAWFLLLHSGIFYPVFDAGDLQGSWGRPTLVGAWVVHLVLALGLLLVVAVPFAVWRAVRRDRSFTQRVAKPARSQSDALPRSVRTLLH
jgi:hypothetical protein